MVLVVDEVSGFLYPEVFWTKSLSYAFICILTRKKSSVKISMRRSFSEVYTGIVISNFLNFLATKVFLPVCKVDECGMGMGAAQTPISSS